MVVKYSQALLVHSQHSIAMVAGFSSEVSFGAISNRFLQYLQTSGGQRAATINFVGTFSPMLHSVPLIAPG